MDPCYSSWADWIESTWAASPPARVLDLCCGTGLMTAELVARGYDVVGVDASPAMLALARTRLGPDVPLIEAWLPDLPVPGGFDAAVSTLDGLNYLTGDDLATTFAATARMLRPGGWMVFDLHGPAALPFAQTHPVITGEQDGSGFTLTTDVNGCIVTTTIEFVGAPGSSSAGTFTESHTQHLHSTEEVRRALESAGFMVLGAFDEYSERALTESTLRVTWVARLEAP